MNPSLFTDYTTSNSFIRDQHEVLVTTLRRAASPRMPLTNHCHGIKRLPRISLELVYLITILNRGPPCSQQQAHDPRR